MSSLKKCGLKHMAWKGRAGGKQKKTTSKHQSKWNLGGGSECLCAEKNRDSLRIGLELKIEGIYWGGGGGGGGVGLTQQPTEKSLPPSKEKRTSCRESPLKGGEKIWESAVQAQ